MILAGFFLPLPQIHGHLCDFTHSFRMRQGPCASAHLNTPNIIFKQPGQH
jgi:hypothetical protein